MRTAAAVVLGVALLSGCTSTVSGGPAPAEGPMPVALLDPCALIQPGDLTGHGAFKAPRRHEVDDARVCAYNRDGASDFEQRFSVSVGVRDDRTLDTVRSTSRGKTFGNVNGRKAVTVPTSSFDCFFHLAIGERSRVDILVLGTDVNSCALAEKVGAVVEPRLPKR
ncbi:DUF3558 family protein [Allokutzneria sp. NRRL B-24872]|uniref:DUF3558 family protein n=1 Tax=Allokutzneria sp. NRRL B-24872 TaxID=1137961 RepID=UPI00143E06C4|nr:DUF3558 family protein [Allokutzneria sp. NRRL B-24872]